MLMHRFLVKIIVSYLTFSVVSLPNPFLLHNYVYSMFTGDPPAQNTMREAVYCTGNII
jgi:hypothetical protein